MGLQQPVVMAASSCYVKRYAVTGALQLSSTPATYVYLNPNVLETRHILDVYNELFGSTPLLEFQPHIQDNAEDEAPVNRMDLGTLMRLNPEMHRVTIALAKTIASK